MLKFVNFPLLIWLLASLLQLLTLCSLFHSPPPPLRRAPCSIPEIWILVPLQVMCFLYIAPGTVEYLLYMIWSHVLDRHLFYLPTDAYTWVWVAPLLQVDFPKWKMIHIWWFISVSHFSRRRKNDLYLPNWVS